MNGNRPSIYTISLDNTTIHNTPAVESVIPRAKMRWKTSTSKIGIINSWKIQSVPPTYSAKRKRPNKLKEIFLNLCKDKVTIKSVFSSLAGILLGVMSTLLFNLWPQHEVIENQRYWYESTILLIFGWGPIATANIVNLSLFCTGSKGKNSLKPCLIAYIFGAMSMIVSVSLIYFLWKYCAGLVWPMPFQGYTVGVIGWYTMSITLWFQFPKEWRSSPTIRKKILYALLFLNVMVIAELTYKGILGLFHIVPRKVQWTLVFVLLVVREWHSWILSYLGQKISGGEDLSVEAIAIHYAAVRHIIFLSVNLGGITTNFTNYLMFGFDFVINIGCTLVTMYLIKKPRSEKNDSKLIKAAMTQIINESVEFIMPIAYCACYMMAYFGPNAELMGNVKNDSWHFTSVKNIHETLFWNAMMFVIDLGSTTLTILLLFWHSKINILKMYFHMQEQMWYILAIQQGYIISEVRLEKLRLELMLYISSVILFLLSYTFSYYLYILLNFSILCSYLYRLQMILLSVLNG